MFVLLSKWNNAHLKVSYSTIYKWNYERFKRKIRLSDKSAHCDRFSSIISKWHYHMYWYFNWSVLLLIFLLICTNLPHSIYSTWRAALNCLSHIIAFRHTDKSGICAFFIFCFAFLFLEWNIEYSCITFNVKINWQKSPQKQTAHTAHHFICYCFSCFSFADFF